MFKRSELFPKICLIKCFKGHKSLGSLCNVVKTLIVSGNRQRDGRTMSPIKLLWTAKNGFNVMFTFQCNVFVRLAFLSSGQLQSHRPPFDWPTITQPFGFHFSASYQKSQSFLCCSQPIELLVLIFQICFASFVVQ